MYYVYKHICPNGKVYIGLTGLNFERRWNNGFGYKNNPAFFKDIVKYGWDNFEHIILSKHTSKEEGLREEAYQILLYNATDSLFGYNFAQSGSAQTKSIAQYTKDGKHIATFKSLKDASAATGINISSICLCCKGRQGTSNRKSAGGYIWRYLNEKEVG